MKMRNLLTIAMPFIGETPRAESPHSPSGKTQRTAPAGKVLYGLPCARCGVYYAAELTSCPVCNSRERTFPLPKPVRWPVSGPRPEADPLPGENMAGLAMINRDLFASSFEHDA